MTYLDFSFDITSFLSCFSCTEMAFGSNGVNAEGRRRLYSCKYCDKAFTSAQALGGHQNGHRRERDVVNRLHQDPNRFLASQSPLNISPPSIQSFDPSPTISLQAHNFVHPSLNLGPDLTYYQNYYHHHQPYLFNYIDQGPTSVSDASSRNYVFGSSYGNGGGLFSRNETYWRLPNHAGMDAAATRLTSSLDMNGKESEIDLTLRL